MKTAKDKILFIRNYINQEVLELTKFEVPQVSYIYGANRLYGANLLNKLFNIDRIYLNYDYLVFVDEDCKLSDVNIVYDIIEEMEDNQYDIAGPVDGWPDQSWIRGFRPDVPNLFFVIMKTEKMKKSYSSISYSDWLIPRLTSLSDEANVYEPYYKMLTYLVYDLKMKFYHIKCIEGSDHISTILNYNDKNFAIHTWYTRFFNYDRAHHDRIIKMLTEF